MSFVLPACLGAALALTEGLSAPIGAAPVECMVLVSLCCLLAQAAYLTLTVMYYLIAFVMQHIEQLPYVAAPAAGGSTAERKVIVTSLYLGGTGAFLALPALCLWDLEVSLAFLGVLTLASLCEPAKYVDFEQRSVDTAAAVRRLGRIHVALHASALGAQATLWWLHAPPREHNWAMIMFAAASPLFLRGASALPPSQVLEMGLPVSALWSILVLCWYVPREQDLRFMQAPEPVVVAFLVLCPPSLTALLACLLQGFRRREGALAVVGLTLAAALRHARPSVPVVLSQLALGAHVAYLAFERHRTRATTVADPSSPYKTVAVPLCDDLEPEDQAVV